jgi:chromosome segregation ATPase
MSFKDLAQIEGYNLDEMETEIKRLKNTAGNIAWANKQVISLNQKLKGEKQDLRAQIAKLEAENRAYKEMGLSTAWDEVHRENKQLKARIAELEGKNKALEDRLEKKEPYGQYNCGYDDDDIPPGHSS